MKIRSEEVDSADPRQPYDPEAMVAGVLGVLCALMALVMALGFAAWLCVRLVGFWAAPGGV